MHLFDQKYRQNSNVVKYYNSKPFFYLKCHIFLWWQSWIFSIITHYYHMFLQKSFLYADLLLNKHFFS